MTVKELRDKLSELVKDGLGDENVTYFDSGDDVYLKVNQVHVDVYKDVTLEN
ncbi:hypothetical protein [Liquorilactobacillus mali]|uniref:Uncharacterized protein n=1 Tax=Liquorilactobacillus mali KCTC 3596 = DSM 20444 TaxID=1046596 RepID=A0A0R2DZK8_9LACO|nr:hypothetical protein [Liquorilactobacillus mali]KRN09406.1 hypothetical protein FD00_GL001129 [Liquorilactobacillus mali KCTC 3596 = DSM 20444]